MGREIDKVVEILNFYKNLGFKDLPEQFINSLLERQSLNVLASDYDTSSDQEKLSIEKLNEQIRNCKKMSSE